MSIDTIEEELNPSDREILAQDRERWARMGAGAHLDDWLAYAPGLMLRRQLAMKIAFTNAPVGKGYNMAFAALMERDGLHTMDKASISAILWLHEHPERMDELRKLRHVMTVGQRSRLNSPISARQRIEKILSVRGTTKTDPVEPKLSPYANLQKANIELQFELDSLKKRSDGGSLFDLRKDTVEDIASIIIKTVSASKVEKLARALLNGAQKPAG
jgi:hypothetical protein